MRNQIVKLGAFAILSLLWTGFAVALIFNWQLLDSAWMAFRSWPPLVQMLTGLLFLPLVAGLWIWETHWPFLLRLVLVAFLARVTMYTFFPLKAKHQPLALEKRA